VFLPGSAPWDGRVFPPGCFGSEFGDGGRVPCFFFPVQKDRGDLVISWPFFFGEHGIIKKSIKMGGGNSNICLIFVPKIGGSSGFK